MLQEGVGELQRVAACWVQTRQRAASPRSLLFAEHQKQDPEQRSSLLLETAETVLQSESCSNRAVHIMSTRLAAAQALFGLVHEQQERGKS